ncbi:dioxygenase family protein [Stieleria varia]|uniref:Protocatechuate 3,4-dioxygenase beta chain n=1 Tax=Stieleria varia TaxID=2528005 RepID=A0A5C6B1Q0_9BACT|nr:protocatechuate 3,4-dioxygenase [Stieleria varia]TWU05511.1 Protocatechuate 3,4-dioxygenase beta chain [Stieleria varia]
MNISTFNRRQALTAGIAASAMMTTRGLFAEQLVQTAAMTEGPFYPDKLPLDTDNDLLVINDAITPAVGEITHLTGKVLTASGSPVRNAYVEIWQVDNQGAYLHTGSSNRERRDGNFQGYGRFLTDSAGRYYFRTIKPVPYPGRTPHIHFAVSQSGKRVLTTQMLIAGEKQNDTDGLVKRIRDPEALKSILVDFKPMAESTLGELTANFDIVLGKTPKDG